MFKKLSILICLIPISLWAQNENWVYFYDGQEHCSDIARAIVYGADGNIYIAGESSGPSSTDFTIVSLNSSGSEQWVYNYNGTADLVDCANAIVYGDDGNIYAAGYSKEESDDILIVSLTSSGSERWVYHYDGPVDSVDYAYSIVYGDDGNIYVAGESYGIGSKLDIVVISLTPDGNERWVYRFNGQGNRDDCAYSMTYGTDGNIYVAGYSSGYPGATKIDFVVISIDNSGQQRWFYLYNGPTSDDDGACSVVYGTDGKIYAAGYSMENSDDVVVVSLSSSGTEQWVYRYDGSSSGADRATALTYGDDNNLYIAGETWRGTSNRIDLLVLSLDNMGSERWQYYYDGMADSNDYAHSIVYGGDGNIYASGYSRGSGTLNDFVMLSLNTAGSERWVYQHNGSADDNDCAYSIVYGSDGNVYGSGYSMNSSTLNDFLIISLNNSGTERWVYEHDGLISGRDRANAVVYGSDNCIYAAGESYGAGYSLQKFTVVGLDGSGAE